MPFVKLTLKGGRQVYFNSDFIWQIGDADEPGKASISLDLEEGDPSLIVQGTADEIATAVNAACAAE